MPGSKRTLNGVRNSGHKHVPIPVPDAKRQENHNAMLDRMKKRLEEKKRKEEN